jgi:hypothetical protein
MASGFYVNTEHLGYFAEQVGRNRRYAREAQNTMDLKEIQDEVIFSGQTAAALHYLVPSLEKWGDRADHDNEAAI